MNRITRALALPLLSAGILGGALGLAGTASASTHTEPQGPGHSVAPSVKAQPAPNAHPGARWHYGHHHLADLQPTTVR
jgi:hypothetical protein